MGRSRYRNTEIIDGKFYGTYDLPANPGGYKEVDLLEGVSTFEYVWKLGDRLDILASKHFQDSDYWWIIALVNNIAYPFSSGGLTPGTAIRIPFDVNDVLNKLE